MAGSSTGLAAIVCSMCIRIGNPERLPSLTIPETTARRHAKLDTQKGRAQEMKRYAVVFEKASRNWAAYVPDLPGCVTTGSTIEEARRLVAEAIEFHIESVRLRGESVPEPSFAETVEIRAA